MTIKGGNPLFTVEVNPGANGAMFDIKTTIGGKAFTREVSTDDPLLADYAMLGAKTKFQNTFGALPADKKSVETILPRVEELYARHDAGEWNLEREEGDGAPSGGLVARAVAEVRGKSVADVVAHIRGLFASIEDEKKRAAAVRKAWSGLEVDEEFKPTVDRLREEDKAKRLARVKVDPQANKSLLAGL